MAEETNSQLFDVLDVVYHGRGIARVDGLVTFIDGALPGEKVRAKVVKRKNNFQEAELLEVVSPSEHRIPSCVGLLHGRFPGIVYAHVDYMFEVALKDAQFRNFLRNFLDDATSFLPPFASPRDLSYRKKIVLHYQVGRDGVGRLGYYGSDNRTVFRVDSCPLALKEINDCLASFSMQGLKSGDSVTFRYTAADGVMVWKNKPSLKAKFLTEHTSIGDLKVPLNGFFQVNSFVGEELIRQVREWLSEIKSEGCVTSLLDLYCGVGVFALAASLDGFGRVVGVESGYGAVAAAKENARSLGLSGVSFYGETVDDAAKAHFYGIDLSSSAIVIDPPRQGIEPNALKIIVSSGAKYIIYVSCDPATLSRDLGVLCKGGYRIEKARMLDMFPRTMHFESALLLKACK